MRARFAGAAGVAAAVWMLGAVQPAYADPPGPNALPITVVSIKTEESDQQADALTTSLKAEVRRLQGWSLVEGDHSLEIITLALKCPSPPDAACELRIADEIKSDRYIWGTVDAAPGKTVAGRLHLWTREGGHTSADISFSDNLTESSDDSLRKIVRDALATLTGGPPKGSVKLSANDVSGQLFVDGEPSGEIKNGSATILVAAGSHTIELRARGYSNASGKVTVAPNGSVSMSLQPVLEEQASGGTKPNYRRIGAYSALAVGGVLAAGSVYSALKVNAINNDDGFDTYRKAMPKGADVCDQANANVEAMVEHQPLPGAASPSDVSSMCSSARSFQTLQWIFLGLGAVSVGTGAYLLATDHPSAEQQSPSPPAARLQILPSASTHAGTVDLRLTF